MSYIILILIIVILAIVIVVLQKKIQDLEEKASSFVKTTEDKGICGTASERSRIKEQNKLKILELLKQSGRVANNDVEKALGVSDATATNYLDELEKEGKIEQVGETGQSVYYKLVNG